MTIRSLFHPFTLVWIPKLENTVSLSIHPPEGSPLPDRHKWKVPVKLSLPAIVPPAVVPVPPAGTAVAVAVVDSSFLEHDEKDNVKIIKISNGIFILILFL